MRRSRALRGGQRRAIRLGSRRRVLIEAGVFEHAKAEIARGDRVGSDGPCRRDGSLRGALQHLLGGVRRFDRMAVAGLRARRRAWRRRRRRARAPRIGASKTGVPAARGGNGSGTVCGSPASVDGPFCTQSTTGTMPTATARAPRPWRSSGRRSRNSRHRRCGRRSLAAPPARTIAGRRNDRKARRQQRGGRQPDVGPGAPPARRRCRRAPSRRSRPSTLSTEARIRQHLEHVERRGIDREPAGGRVRAPAGAARVEIRSEAMMRAPVRPRSR